MPFKDFRVCETLGKGSFASVYKVIRKSDNKVYALKRIKINKMSKREISDSLNEIRFLASIRHKNIVGFLEAFLENNDTELCIIMEYCGCGDLAQKVERYKRRKQYIDEDVIWRYLIQSIKALAHLHEKGICHRDLKTANSFLAEDGSVKIGDMNVSKRLKGNGNLKTQIGTPYYMSPEIWNNRPYDSSSDVWSLGCMIYELCALRPPFVADSFPALKRAVTNGRFSPIPSKFSDGLGKVINSMLKLNPNSRPSAKSLLDHPSVRAKLSLDGEVVPREPVHAFPGMMATIKVPHNLNKLNAALPKPCYADARPNSPSAWVVAEQAAKAKKEARAAQKAAKAAAAALEAEKAAAEAGDGVQMPPAPPDEPVMVKAPKGKLAKLDQDCENVHSNQPSAPVAPPVSKRPRAQRPSVHYDVNGRRQQKPVAQPSQAPANPYAEGRAAAQAKYMNYNGYGRGYGNGYAGYVPSGAAGPAAPSQYGHYYGQHRYGDRAAGQPSKQYPQRMW